MRTRQISRTGTAVMLAFCAVALGAGPALATGFGATEQARWGSRLPAAAPFNVPGGITDLNDALEGRTGEVQAALDALADETSYQLFVVYVDSFDGMSGVNWADESAVQSGLGAKDLLLAVATEDRSYGISVAEDSGLSTSDLDSIESAAENKLRDSDWAGAAIAAADTTRDVTSGGSGVSTGGVVAVLGVVAVGAGAVVVVRRKKSSARTAGSGDDLTTMSTPDLEKRAGSVLVAIDDAVRASEEELGFAQAQFGIDATGQFATTLEAAKKEVAAAFTARQQLDSGDVDEPRRRTVLAQIIARCTAVSESLDAESETFGELRNLHANAPQVLAETAQRVGEIRTRIEAARATLAGLATTYSPAALTSVTGNPDQVEALLNGAIETVDKGRAAIDSQDQSTAVALTRAAQNAVAQATTLLDAVDHAGAELANIMPRLDEQMTSIASDLADLARLRGTTPAIASDPALEAAADEARAATVAAQSARAQTDGSDPLGALTRLISAEASLDAALASYRAADEQARRASALLTEAIGQADARIRGVNDYISTRRGAVGPEARTQLAEANRLVAAARALAATDPAGALTQAQQAEALAREAANLAERDTSQWSSSQGGSNDLGMLLGGILLGNSMNSRRSNGFGGWGGGYSPGSRSSGQSWGGSSGSQGRPSGGGSRGGGSRGGGSSRGGRF